MKQQILSLLFLLSSIAIFHPLHAQSSEKITPLHKFFQENYDSTIIYHNWTNWYSAPNYLIVAKQSNRIYFFTYKSPYKNVRGMFYPGELVKKFSKEEQEFKNTVPDTNRYLFPKALAQIVLIPYWNELQTEEVWSLKDDKYSLRSAGNCIIEDGQTDMFYLIEKAGIKGLKFYEPDFWQDCLRKDSNRQKAINTREIMQRIAREE